MGGKGTDKTEKEKKERIIFKQNATYRVGSYWEVALSVSSTLYNQGTSAYQVGYSANDLIPN